MIRHLCLRLLPAVATAFGLMFVCVFQFSSFARIGSVATAFRLKDGCEWD